MNDPEHTAESGWMERCRGGDKEAYGLFVKKYMKQAYFAALGFVGSHEDALDLSQDAFARAYVALDRFDPEQRFYTWYYRILKNLCLNFLRHRKARAATMAEFIDISNEEAQSELASPELPVDERLEREELRRQVWKALWELDVKDRELIVARDLLNTSYQMLAELLGCPLGTVMSRLYYARRRLREKLEGSI